MARFDEIAKIMVFPPWQFETIAEKASAVKREPTLFADAALARAVVGAASSGEDRSAFCLAAACRGACACMPPITTAPCPPSYPKCQCPCPMTRSRASRFAMSWSAPRRTFGARRPSLRQMTRFLRVHYEITLK